MSQPAQEAGGGAPTSSPLLVALAVTSFRAGRRRAPGSMIPRQQVRFCLPCFAFALPALAGFELQIFLAVGRLGRVWRLGSRGGCRSRRSNRT